MELMARVVDDVVRDSASRWAKRTSAGMPLSQARAYQSPTPGAPPGAIPPELRGDLPQHIDDKERVIRREQLLELHAVRACLIGRRAAGASARLGR